MINNSTCLAMLNAQFMEIDRLRAENEQLRQANMHHGAMVEKISAENKRLRRESDRLREIEITLPKITDDLVDQFYPWLIADDPTYQYTWNQAAVDFACALKEAALRGGVE